MDRLKPCTSQRGAVSSFAALNVECADSQALAQSQALDWLVSASLLLLLARFMIYDPPPMIPTKL